MSKVENSLAPLLDIALCLVAVLCTRQEVLPQTIDLPTARAREELSGGQEAEVLRVALKKDGTIFWDGHQIEVQELSSLVHGRQSLVLQADAETRWQRVFELKAYLQSMGISLIEQGNLEEKL